MPQMVPNYMQHDHAHEGFTSYEAGHTHPHVGVSGPPLPGPGGHIHYIEDVTVFESGHLHPYKGYTGPVIPLPGNMHTHEFMVMTEMVDLHRHAIKSLLKPAPEHGMDHMPPEPCDVKE